MRFVLPLLALGACTMPDKVALEEYAPQSPDADIEAVSLSASDDDAFDPERVGTEFPDTTEQVAVWYRWDEADSGKKVGIRWSKDGQVVLEQGDTLAKVSGASAYVLKMAAGSKLPIGDYQVELLEDGVAVTKIPFKVGEGSGEDPEAEMTAAAPEGEGGGEAADLPEEGSEEPQAEEPVQAEVAAEPVAEASADEVPAAAMTTGSGASSGFSAAQPTKWPGVTVQVTEFSRKGKNLNAKLRFTNNGTTKARPDFHYRDTYLLDDDNRKYPVLQDDKGAYLGSLGSGYTYWWGENIEPGASRLVWMRFEAPPAGVKTMTFQVGELDPFENVRIQN
ncbi:MAG: hypothetical protein ACREMZ_05515 [Gemmatimonadales bacterium]